MNPTSDFQIGDKVLVRSGPHAGVRGSVISVAGDMADVALADRREAVALVEMLNYSAAARKAWRTRPHRGAGRRPRGDNKKQMVSLRIDSNVWRRLGNAVRAGLIRSREAAVNTWLQEKLAEIEQECGPLDDSRD